ncbi:uncharacterized protein LOC105425941 [Pogonomyrmex barbatus]|uniref:Uncharacterized protein LOC105425941 n=1 Tax=Pogonomyrmex barbatus TaxID=144034 RepID=A0A6I9W958_9HYME|nr:uncharacterized protein LOC105425941 [Pogonomyrmex barbatus]XP_011635267.1 uncharacterized protein LOC105425941 [Pogonomyrmex barbatus]XP_011635268.1 uncharacterized protein LOC105425941 [Pogonomyrmex barbatus]
MEACSTIRMVSAVIFIGIFSHLTSNVYFLIILLLSEIIFGLDSFGEWEDLILYKHENKAIIQKSVWSDKLCSDSSGEFSLMRLTDIRHVGISTEMGLYILHRNGFLITLSMKGLTREEIQNLRKEINYFLNMSRFKYPDRSLINPSDQLLLSFDSKEPLKNLPRSCPMFNEFTLSDNVLGSTLNRACYRIQQNSSYPSLMFETQFDNSHLANLKRGPYTENSTHFNYFKCTRNIRSIPTMTTRKAI